MEQAEVIRFAGDIAIDVAEVISANGFSQNVTAQVAGIEIYEDMFSPFITGVIGIRDSQDLTNLFPFVGEEYINLSIHTPTFEGRDKVIKDQFYIYKVTNRIQTNNRSTVYELHFFSREALVDVNKKISKSYQGKISDIANTLLTDKYAGLETVKPVFIEETINSAKFISNYWSPVTSLNYILDRAKNGKGNPSYLFFENRRGFNFISTKTLYNQDIVQTFIQDENLRDFRSDGSSMRNIEKEYKRIIDINVPTVFDYLDNIISGKFGSKQISYDLVTKKYKVNTYNMFESFENDDHLNKFASASQNVVSRSSALVLRATDHWGSYNGIIDATNSASSQHRISIMKQLESTIVEITVPGRTDYTVGDKIYMDITKLEQITKKDIDITDKILSGNYIISAIHHNITRDSHECKLELIKDTFLMDLDKDGT